jgi:uncharacterized membrane protein
VSSGLDHAIARLLVIGTLASVALLAIGVILMSVVPVAPLAGAPRFQPALILDDLAHFRPAGYLWLGLIAAIATPTARVMASLVGYARSGERSMAVVAALILAVLLLSVSLGLGVEG